MSAVTETTEIHAEAPIQVIEEGFPQVNLLPTEIANKRTAHLSRNVALSVLAVGIIGVAGVSALAYINANQAEERVLEADAELTELEAQIAALADVPKAKAQVDLVDQGIEKATAGEVDWRNVFVAALKGHPPGQVAFSQWTLSTTSVAGTPTSDVGMASLQVSGDAANLETVANWVTTWNAPQSGITGARYSSASRVGEDGNVFTFTAAASVQDDLSLARPTAADLKAAAEASQQIPGPASAPGIDPAAPIAPAPQPGDAAADDNPGGEQ